MISKNAKIIWDYMLMQMPLKPCECIFVLGSNDVRVAEYAVQLLQQGLGQYIVFSGGFGNFTQGVFAKPEAELFADIAIEMGVPPQKIYIENKATNTGENVSLTMQLLAQNNVNPKSFLLVQKPFMERRSIATFQKQVPNIPAIVTSPPISFEKYPNEVIDKETLIHTLVGDMQRIIEYPAKGYITLQAVPSEVEKAFLQLIQAGYTNHLTK